VALGAGGLRHMALDSIAGEIRWLAPVSDWSLTLVIIPAAFDSWILRFVTHWTFGIEVALTVVAVGVWVRRRGAPPRRSARGVVD
jgi:inner membrane protein